MCFNWFLMYFLFFEVRHQLARFPTAAQAGTGEVAADWRQHWRAITASAQTLEFSAAPVTH